MGQSLVKPRLRDASPKVGSTRTRVDPFLPTPESTQTKKADELTHMDTSQSSALPLPRLASQSRGRFKKLSKRAKTPQRSRTDGPLILNKIQLVDQDTKELELLAASTDITNPSMIGAALRPSETMQASAFKPSSMSKGSSTIVAPSHQDPDVHRQSSMTSFTPGRLSARSSNRAEREWRKRVAALAGAGASSTSSRSSLVEPALRGPVPPRRNPMPFRSPSPEEYRLVTPPHGDVDKGTVAKTIMSNRSFETLGHYAHLRPENEDPTIRERKASVPQSISSFYFDSNSHGGTRPSSLAAGQLLTPISTSQKQQRLSLPPINSFRSSPSSVDETPMNSPVLPLRTENDVREGTLKEAERESIPASETRYEDPILHYTAGPPLRNEQCRGSLTLDFIHIRSAPHGPPTSHVISERPSPQTSNSYRSPMTTYIPTAPVDRIPLTQKEPRKSEAVPTYPHAVSLVQTVPPVSLISGPKMPLRQVHCNTPTRPNIHSDNALDPFTSEGRSSTRSHVPSRAGVVDHLKIRSPAPKLEILGTGGWKRANLTPGLETGDRPPKSGLPFAVSSHLFSQ
ncbi:MAG: hypothetical protein TREMPRED_001583 [Tremellales sp. Tagirdzhanova-0007]|nr:MAG: hypothetical protein TREMPRED_001583 [Tremellales sp. Tagirdzhanova-0007]